MSPSLPNTGFDTVAVCCAGESLQDFDFRAWTADIAAISTALSKMPVRPHLWIHLDHLPAGSGTWINHLRVAEIGPPAPNQRSRFKTSLDYAISVLGTYGYRTMVLVGADLSKRPGYAQKHMPALQAAIAAQPQVRFYSASLGPVAELLPPWPAPKKGAGDGG